MFSLLFMYDGFSPENEMYKGGRGGEGGGGEERETPLLFWALASFHMLKA